MTKSDGITPPDRAFDRRKQSRSYVAGVAVITRPDHVGSSACLVRNLSVGGAMLLSSPPMVPGEQCRLALTAPGLMAEELSVRIVRSGSTAARTHWVAVEFDFMSLDLRHRLEQVVSLELTRASAPAVLVVDNDEWKLAHIAEQLAQHSRRALLAMSSLEAIHWLTQSATIALALVGDSVSGSESATMLDYIGTEFPNIHRAAFREPLPEGALRRLLDRVEIESASHSPWLPGDFGIT